MWQSLFKAMQGFFFSALGLNQTWQFVIFNKIFSKILFILLSKWEAAQSPEQLPSSFIFILSGLSLPALLATSRTNRAHLGQVLDTLLSMSLESVRDFVVCFPARPPPLCEPHSSTLQRPRSLMGNAGEIYILVLSASKWLRWLDWRYGDKKNMTKWHQQLFSLYYKISSIIAFSNLMSLKC